MLERLLIAGSGGQGIVLAGKILATVCMRTISHVTFFPSYGAEVRGGVSSCQIVLSAREIASPLPPAFDSLLLLDQASADRYIPQASPEARILINRSLIDPPAGDAPPCIAVEASQIATDLGDVRAANFVILGAYLARMPVATAAAIEEEIPKFVGPGKGAMADLDIRAFRAGLTL